MDHDHVHVRMVIKIRHRRGAPWKATRRRFSQTQLEDAAQRAVHAAEQRQYCRQASIKSATVLCSCLRCVQVCQSVCAATIAAGHKHNDIVLIDGVATRKGDIVLDAMHQLESEIGQLPRHTVIETNLDVRRRRRRR